jgi:dinuclear metal center YbgI/SA1388 family protein
MSGWTAQVISTHLDELLSTHETPDYSGALNGLQFENRAPIRRAAAAVDLSRRTIEGAADADANLLIVHHGMFWGGAQRMVGAPYERVRLLVENDVALYASHLPLDAHPTLGNNALLAKRLQLHPTGGFARYQTIEIGLQGHDDVPTQALLERADAFAREHGGNARATQFAAGRVTQRWAVCSGAGASTDTLREARDAGIDTLIVGEGPHHTAVEAPEVGLVIIYAGHYATETLGVCALAEHVSATFDIPWSFIEAPTGL